MTAWLDALNNAWNELAQTAPVVRQFRTKLVSTRVSLDVLAALRAADNAPCLMLQTTLVPEAMFELGGMRLSTVPGDCGNFLVLSLEDSSRRDLFATICSDVVAAAAAAESADARDQFLARLDAWRQFLRDRRTGLSRSDTIGLVGELLVLERMLDSDKHSLAYWQAPNDGLHDFAIGSQALEIKTGIGPAATITISRLDQLDTSGISQLDLLHVRLIETPDGRSLRDITSGVTDRLPDETSRRAFENALLRRGLMPDDDAARSHPVVQLRSIDAYTVTDGFPRLIRSTLPIAITEATYTLEVRAIAPFLSDAATVLDAFIQRDHA